MFSGILLKQKSAVRGIGIDRAFCCNCFECNGDVWFSFIQDQYNGYDAVSTGLHFSLILLLLVCTFIFFLLSAKDMEKVGMNYADYFALDIFYSLRYHTCLHLSVHC